MADRRNEPRPESVNLDPSSDPSGATSDKTSDKTSNEATDEARSPSDGAPAAGPLEPEQVAAWLLDHPDFLTERPELAEQLQVPVGDDAVSLTEFRSRRLVDENERLRRQLAELGAIAGENEQLMRRLHTLTLALTATSNPAELFDELARRLRADFRADTLRIKLRVASDVAAEGVLVEPWDSEVPDWLQPVLDERRPECGRLTRQKRDWLFGDEADGIGSAALVPIGDAGLLVIGAQADDRFQPGMGTLFLELLGETLARRLAALAADRGQRRSA